VFHKTPLTHMGIQHTTTHMDISQLVMRVG